MTKKQLNRLQLRSYLNQLNFSIKKEEAARSPSSKKYWKTEIVELRAIVVALQNQFRSL
jgi:hypothetical protein